MSEELAVPAEYQEFLDKFEQIGYIAFGTTFMPSDSDMGNIISAIRMADPETTGFIISLKE